MENVELTGRLERTLDTDRSKPERQRKSDTDYEAPLGVNNATDEEHPVNDVADEYPSVIRRTAIVTGVALALFCVSY